MQVRGCTSGFQVCRLICRMLCLHPAYLFCIFSFCLWSHTCLDEAGPCFFLHRRLLHLPRPCHWPGSNKELRGLRASVREDDLGLLKVDEGILQPVPYDFHSLTVKYCVNGIQRPRAKLSLLQHHIPQTFNLLLQWMSFIRRDVRGLL